MKSKIGIDESQSQDIHTGRALGTKGVQGDTALLCAVKPLKRNYTVLSNRTGWSVLAVRGSIRESLIPAAKTDGVKTDSIAAVSVTKLYPNEVPPFFKGRVPLRPPFFLREEGKPPFRAGVFLPP